MTITPEVLVQLHPEAPKPKTKSMPCSYCERPIEVGIRTRNQPRHFECGLTVALEAMRQMQSKSGPYYSRYIMGMRAYADKIGRH